MAKKVFVFLGHPNSDSYCASLFKAYIEGARLNSASVKCMQVGKMDFDPNLKWGYTEIQALEPDLIQFQQNLAWCDHIVWIYPNWWSGFPAKMKGVIDRAILPDIHFKEISPNQIEPLLHSKSCRVIMSLDAPKHVYIQQLNRPPFLAMQAIMKYIGIQPIKETILDQVIYQTPTKLREWINEIKSLGFKETKE